MSENREFNTSWAVVDTDTEEEVEDRVTPAMAEPTSGSEETESGSDAKQTRDQTDFAVSDEVKEKNRLEFTAAWDLDGQRFQEIFDTRFNRNYQAGYVIEHLAPRLEAIGERLDAMLTEAENGPPEDYERRAGEILGLSHRLTNPPEDEAIFVYKHEEHEEENAGYGEKEYLNTGLNECVKPPLGWTLPSSQEERIKETLAGWGTLPQEHEYSHDRMGRRTGWLRRVQSDFEEGHPVDETTRQLVDEIIEEMANHNRSMPDEQLFGEESWLEEEHKWRARYPTAEEIKRDLVDREMLVFLFSNQKLGINPSIEQLANERLWHPEDFVEKPIDASLQETIDLIHNSLEARADEENSQHLQSETQEVREALQEALRGFGESILYNARQNNAWMTQFRSIEDNEENRQEFATKYGYGQQGHQELWKQFMEGSQAGGIIQFGAQATEGRTSHGSTKYAEAQVLNEHIPEFMTDMASMDITEDWTNPLQEKRLIEATLAAWGSEEMSRDNPFHPGRMAQDIATLAKQLDMRRWDQEYLGITKSERDFVRNAMDNLHWDTYSLSREAKTPTPEELRENIAMRRILKTITGSLQPVA